MVHISNEAFAAKLRVEGAWLVSTSSSQIKLTKKFGVKNAKIVSFMLQRQTNGLYYIEPVTYEFRSTVSHFEYFTNENRWARNKNFFKVIFDTLKKTNTLSLVENLDTFIKVNTSNKKSNKDTLQGQLRMFKTKVGKKK